MSDPSPAIDGSITIRHQDGVCVYGIAFVDIAVSERGLDLEIEAEDNPGCALGFLPGPSLFAERARIKAKSLGEIEREEIEAERGGQPGDESADNVFRIYIGAHYPLDNNRLSLRRLDRDRLELAWTADADDFKHYGEKAKRNAVEVRCVCAPGA